jgi:hypothetical protein
MSCGARRCRNNSRAAYLHAEGPQSIHGFVLDLLERLTPVIRNWWLREDPHRLFNGALKFR